MDTVRDKAVVVLKVEKRPTTVETPVMTTQPKKVLPLPLPKLEFLHVLAAPPAV